MQYRQASQKRLVRELFFNQIDKSPKLKTKDSKEFKKCIRIGCEKLTTHNGGYCSAECCKLDREKK